MAHVVLLSTGWGPKHGGINSFNTDFANALGEVLAPKTPVTCVVLEATREESDDAKRKRVNLLQVGKSPNHSYFEPSRSHDVVRALKSAGITIEPTHWIGHDIITGELANAMPETMGCGSSLAIHHMNYEAYASVKHAAALVAHEKAERQRALFSNARYVYAVGPYLRRSLADMLGEELERVRMLIPGFAQITDRCPPQIFNAVTFGRLDPENDSVKQGRLAIAGFATACKRATDDIHLPEAFRANPSLAVVGIKQPGGDEEQDLRHLAERIAGRVVNLIALPFHDDRGKLFEQLRKSSAAMMLSWHEGFGLTGWEAVAAAVPLVLSRNSGVYELIRDTLGDPGLACVQVVNVRGKRTDLEDSNDSTRGNDGHFHEDDKRDVSEALLKIARDSEKSKKSAKFLRDELRQRLNCSWRNLAIRFAEELDLPTEIKARPQFIAEGNLGLADTETEEEPRDNWVVLEPPSSRSAFPPDTAEVDDEDWVPPETILPVSVHRSVQQYGGEVETRSVRWQLPHASVRAKHRKDLCEILERDRVAWFVAEWGLDGTAFVATALSRDQPEDSYVQTFGVKASLPKDGSGSHNGEVQALVSRCAAALNANGSQFTPVFTVELGENDSESLSPPPSNVIEHLELVAQEILAQIPDSRVLLLANARPIEHKHDLVELLPLEEHDCQRYIEHHPQGGHELAIPRHFDSLFAKSYGLTVYVDWMLDQLRTVSIEELADSECCGYASMEDAQAFERRLDRSIAPLLERREGYSARTITLLRVLAVLPYGETMTGIQKLGLRSIQRIRPHEPFYTENVDELVRLGLVSIGPILDLEQSLQHREPTPRAVGPKLLFLRKQVRDYVVRRVLTPVQYRNIAYKAMDLFFGAKWRTETPAVGWLERLGLGSPTTQHSSLGNVNSVISWLYRDAVSRGESLLKQQTQLVMEAYLETLSRIGRYRDLYLASSEFVRVLDKAGCADEASRICHVLGYALRMLHDHRQALPIQERALQYTGKRASKNWRAAVLLELAETYQSLGNPRAAAEHARGAKELARTESSAGYHCRELLIRTDADLDPAIARSELKRLEERARRKKHMVIADNIALYLASTSPDPATRIQLRQRVLKSPRHGYNTARATVANAADLVRAGRASEMSSQERRLLGSAYSYVFDQRLESLFEDCHEALVEVDRPVAGSTWLVWLYQASDHFWRLAGWTKRGKQHRGELDEGASSKTESSGQTAFAEFFGRLLWRDG